MRLSSTEPISEAVSLSMSNASIPCLISTISLSKPLRSRFEFLCGQFEDIATYPSCVATFSILISTILLSCSFLETSSLKTGILIFPSLAVTFLTLYIMRLYYIHRAHKHGLLCSKSLGLSVIVGLSNSCAIWSSCSTTEDIISILPFLLGGLLPISFATVFAFVSDVWYAIGTGEFQMITVDTCGILFYFGLPLTILTVRFFEKYGELVCTVRISISKVVVSIVQSGGDNMMFLSDPFTALACLASLASFTIMIGLPLLNNLCPLSGHLFGRCYTHGQPNTNMVAVCVNFEDLCQATTDELNCIWKAMPKNGFINIFVTGNELQEHPQKIKDMLKMGHFVGLSMNRCGDDVQSITFSYNLFRGILGKRAEWCHVGEGMSPQAHQLSKELNMKTAFWSIRCDVINNTLSPLELEAIKDELHKSKGGSFIYLTAAGGRGRISSGLIQIFESMGENCIPMKLPMVATDDNSMILNEK